MIYLPIILRHLNFTISYSYLKVKGNVRSNQSLNMFYRKVLISYVIVMRLTINSSE